ncbi:hypothetical protein GYMLUDRAFT_265032, partial [Collybiopsis luxurians FD-317 M1]
MGNLISQPSNEAKRRSDAIDKQIENDSKSFKRECRILILGSSEPRESFINGLKQASIKDGLSEEERAAYHSQISQNVLDSVRALIVAIRKFEMDISIESSAIADKVMNHRPDEARAFTLSPEIAYAIHQLWSDPISSKVLAERGSEFYLMDGAPHFLSQVLRIGSPDYLPTEADILRLRQNKSPGIEATRLTMGNLSLHIYDVVRQRGERRKWIHHFEIVTSVIFCVALTDYDQELLEVRNSNRLMETMILFEAVINSRWFLRTSIILILSEVDEFKKKLSKVPLERHFPEYTGGNDINKAAKYILWKFMQANRARLSIYPHLSRADDPTNIPLIFSAVKETIMHNARRT